MTKKPGRGLKTPAFSFGGDDMSIDAHCAHCKRELSAGYENDSVNVELEKIHRQEKYFLGEPTPFRPYFCGRGCADRAVNVEAIENRLREHLTFDASYESPYLFYEPDDDPVLRQKLIGLSFSEEYRQRVEQEHFLYYRKHYDKFCEQLDTNNRKRNEEEQKEKARLSAEEEKRYAAEEKAAEKQRLRDEKDEEKRRLAWEKEEEKRRLEEEKYQEPIYEIPYNVRFEHTHILAPSGTGKTTMMQQIILDDLHSDNPPAMVIIDPKGEMVRRLRSLDLFNPEDGPLWHRLIVIDATDTDNPPALNMFTTPAGDESTKRRIQNQTIDLFEYIFSSSEFKLTPKQSIGFSFLARLMFEIPGADIFKFLDVVEEEVDFDKGQTSAYAHYIARLDSGAQRFFARDFYGEFKEAKSQVKARLYMILKSPELSAIFNSSFSSVDWFGCLQNRRIILVNTGMNQLGEAASQLFGRYVIASVVAAAGGRDGIKDKNLWTPVFLHVDEAQLFVDERKTQRMLNLSREYKLGITLAHQQMNGFPFTENMRNSVSTNTSVKYAASVEAQDLTDAARDLHCDPEFIRSHQRDNRYVNFACYIRNMGLKGPFTAQAELGNVDKCAQMSAKNLDRLIKLNRQNVRTYVDMSDCPEPAAAFSAARPGVEALEQVIAENDEWG